MEANVSPKQMSYGEFSREVGQFLADCFDGPPAVPLDENPTRHQHALETLTALKEEFLGGAETVPEPQGSGLRGRLEALQKLWR
jgi:hypothetical protein